jgi:hypothetical protein
MKTISGIKGSKGTGTRSITLGSLKALTWSVMPTVVIAVGDAISHPMVKVG